VEGQLDDISGSGQTEAAHDLCSAVPTAKHQHFEVEGAGHYGIFSGRRWREMTYPVVRDFIAKAQASAGKTPTKAVAKSPAVKAAKSVAKTAAKTAVKSVKNTAVRKPVARKPVAKRKAA
jgi:poly(3-hydroxybutyrate) depolymerase